MSLTSRSKEARLVLLAVSALSLLALTLVHVYLLLLGISVSQLLTFWLPLGTAAFLILVVLVFYESSWGLVLVVALAATLHLIIPLGQSPNYAMLEDAVYGYQQVSQTIVTGTWQFGAGTGQSKIYSFFPMLFLFTASWSQIGSIPPMLIMNFAFPIVNLVTFLTLRILGRNLIGLSERQTNILLFMYSLTPTIHRIESKFHYEAYAVIFFPLIFLYALKPRISFSERVVALISIFSIALSHYFTAEIMLLNAVVLMIAYVILRGTQINADLLFLSMVAPLAWSATVAVVWFGRQLVTIESILANVRDLGTLLSNLSASATEPTVTFYPAPWFTDLATVRNMTILALSLLAIFSLCLTRGGRFRMRLKRRDALTYLAAAWLFSVVFSVAAYYGVAWSETVLASQGAGSARNRVAEFSFMQFAIFSSLGFCILLQKLAHTMHEKRIMFAKVAMCVFLVTVFVSVSVVQAYPRIAYDSSYTPVYYDEYSSNFQEPFYVGNWWNGAANHNLTGSRPFSGSRALKSFVRGYGYQVWWEDTLDSPPVDLNNEASQRHTVYYALDLLQLQKPDHMYNETLEPGLLSSQDSRLNAIFSTGRVVVVSKPSTTEF